MNCFKLSVDFNGLVLFDPSRLSDHYGGLEVGRNLWADFTATEKGDEVVRQGIIVPLLGINDGLYDICVRAVNESTKWDVEQLKENGVFPLHVSNRVVIADLALFLEWYPNEGWFDLDIMPGFYEVDILAYRKVVGGVVESCGYDFVLKESKDIPAMSAVLDKDMQVLTLE
ncbi:hypothetical protein K8O61_11890 [Xanthomonas cerealis pv. cerealis]|uniref:hypothetical protein n=1 Tax=Xanthomonas cerealis TaxID=3390025 RepID=UPI001F2D31DA|nr:hypothetical protein [Xanthomonas translucens]UKE68209.1 hypothetical protein K8O61_11890 [Xanthomonas translucens pv. pistacia]